MAEILGWIGNIFFVLGAIAFSAKKPIWGCVHNVIGNLFYIVSIQLLPKPLYALITLSITLASINVWGIYNWRKNESTNSMGRTMD